MGNVVAILNPAQWVEQWEALGGRCYLGNGPFGTDGERTVGLLETMRQCEFGTPRWHETERLRRMVSKSPARGTVVDYLIRMRGMPGEIW